MHAACVSVLERRRACSGKEEALQLCAADSQGGWIPVERLQQSYCRTALPAFPLHPPSCARAGKPGCFPLQRDTFGLNLPTYGPSRAPAAEAGAWSAAQSRHRLRLHGCRSPVVNSSVMNLTLLHALTVPESTKLHQSFWRCFIPLKKGCVKDVVGTRLIR